MLNELPPLPEPDITSTQVRSGGTRVDAITSHSTTQMTSYGQKCYEFALQNFKPPSLPEPDGAKCLAWESFSPEAMTAYGQACQAATLATVTPPVQKNCSSLENLLAAVRGECPALLDEDRGGSAYLGMDARAFLSGATKESTDADQA